MILRNRFLQLAFIGLVSLVVVWCAAEGLAQNPGVVTGSMTNLPNGHKYLLLEAATWNSSEAAAVALGGHLVTMNSQDENSWVYDTFASFGGVARDLWVGLYLPDPQGASVDRLIRRTQFVWISGQPVTDQEWAETNLFLTGYCKLLGPNNPMQFDRGRWAEEFPSTLLNGVVELPAPLEIVTQPKTISVGIGSDAIFKVLADGTSPISYQWQSDGTNLPGETSATLTLTNVRPSQSGSFAVIVSNASGTITSATAFFSVAGIVAWGFNGSLNTGVLIPPGLTSVRAIAAGEMHDLALRSDGTVVAWGDNSYNQLSVPADLTNVVAIAGAEYHSLALKADGTVVSWGYNVWFTGNWVPADLTNVVAIDANGYHNLALKSDGTVVAWGGDGALPSIAPPGLSNVVAISAGGGHNLALKADGTVVQWGDTSGQFDIVPDGLTNVVAISGGTGDSLALKADGTVVGWGANWYGQLDIPPGLTNLVGISAKNLHSLALKADGTVVAWRGEIVPAGLPNVIAIAATSSHSLALLRDGAPDIMVQPWDRAVPAGASPALAAKVVGMQSMTYQWQFNGADIPGATQDTLGISTAQPANAGVYRLAVSNQVGVMISRQAKLMVSSGQRVPILATIPNFTLNPGQVLSYTNVATDSDPSRHLTFSFDTAPQGATLYSDTGIFSWRPSVQSAGTSNYVQIRVTDDSVTPLSDSGGFTIFVNPLQPLVLQPLSFTNNSYRLRVTGTIGPDYILQTSPDLTTWLNLQSNSPSAMPFDFIQTNLNSYPKQFYRVKLGP
jgi:hypothetical protein